MKDDREKALAILQDAEKKLGILYDYEPCRPLAPIVYMMHAAIDSLRVSIKCHYNSGYNPFKE
jgi:hypothetical protein